MQLCSNLVKNIRLFDGYFENPCYVYPFHSYLLAHYCKLKTKNMKKAELGNKYLIIWSLIEKKDLKSRILGSIFI